jgi:uncharacterized protein YjiS (DUF1127 family)
MSTMTVLGQPAVSDRRVPGFIRGCWNALQARRKREKVRAALYGLDGRDLQDIGISYGEIEHVASNPDIDPRGILFDHLVGAREQCRRQGDAQRPGSPQIEHEFEV